MSKKNVFLFVPVAMIALCAFSASAALVDQTELSKLASQAKKNGAVPVMIHLAPTTIDQLRGDLKGVKAAMAQKSERLLAELGQQVWEGGRWDNGIGQIGLYVTDAGLKMLQNSGNAVAFYADQHWSVRTKLGGLDGRHAEIEGQLDSNGYVDVVATLNVDGLEYDTPRNGGVSYRSSTKIGEDARAKAQTLLSSLSAPQAPERNAALARVNSMVTPEVTIRLTREGVVKFAESDLVRSIRPQAFSDVRPVRFDADVLETAQRDGSADVVITVRSPLAGGKQSAASSAAHTQSQKRALEGLFADAGVLSKLQDLSTFGVMAGRLTWAELKALKTSKDSRLLSVELNRVVARPALASSTLMINMPAAWNAGFRAAGQNIVVVDTGVQTNHEFFKDANGASRVFFEGCYGTNALSGGVQYESICPQQGNGNAGVGLGDSPGGLIGSAAPRLNCSSAEPDMCLHGTHVAGIAAGRASPLLPPAGLQGIAPDARIVAVQVFSFDQARVQPPLAFYTDIVTVMSSLASIMTPGTADNPFVINLSLSDSLFTGSCPNWSTGVTTAVQTLFNLGVPVVAATGNNWSTTSIGWPSCVPRVLKVSSVPNDGVGNTRSAFANLVNPGAFPGEFIWLAPGGDFPTGTVTSAIPDATSTMQTTGIRGTSQAAPHIAGFYAAAKAVVPGITVNDISNWIQANASVPVSIDGIVFRRPRLQ